jgi:hypothetical protein
MGSCHLKMRIKSGVYNINNNVCKIIILYFKIIFLGKNVLDQAPVSAQNLPHILNVFVFGRN